MRERRGGGGVGRAVGGWAPPALPPPALTTRRPPALRAPPPSPSSPLCSGKQTRYSDIGGLESVKRLVHLALKVPRVLPFLAHQSA